MRAEILPAMVSARPAKNLDSLKERVRGETDRGKLKEAAQEFEALMLEQMVKEMRKNVHKSDLFGENSGEEIFQEMLDGEYVRIMVQRGGIGLAELMVKQFQGAEKK
ncbi:MAG: rod-binding protein [Deltaproteobacteria bacterium]|nr:rod-binding protein [Deltaproteobacteria bacterium]